MAIPIAAALIAGACTDDQTFASGENALETGVLATGTEQQLQVALDTTVEKYDVPGAVIGVYLPQSEWVQATGVRDIDTDEPMTTDLVWPIRSVTKSFTVTMLLQLVDEGKLSLDDTLDEWVPDMPNADEITLGQLADMTAGVPEYTNDAFIEAFIEDQDGTFSDDDLIGYAETGDPSSEPGAAHLYVNTSTVLLGKVIEEVTGESFADELQERIIEPLGLDDTSYPTEPDGWTGDHATGYQPDDGGLAAQGNNFTVFGPAGAMLSTLDDLRTWGTALATGSLLDPETQAARLEGSPLDEGPEYDQYAFGIGELDGWWGHTGEGFGITALVMHEVDSEATVVILMNLSNADAHVPTKLFRQVAQILTS